jgi:uracil-DNA glycosylase family 4
VLSRAPAQIARARISVRDRVRACNRCPLHRCCSGPVPFHAPMAATLAVLGEAPGRAEDKAGRPFVGPAGLLLRRLMSEAGIDADALAWLNTVSCFPDRTPTAREVAACAPNRLAQLEVLAPTHVLVAGSVALSTVRVDLKITQVHGRLLSDVPGRWLFPVHHPSAALRNPGLVEVLAKELARWSSVTASDRPWEHVGLSCVICGRLADRYDPDGLGWCETHLARGMRGWEKASRGRTRIPGDELLPAVETVTVQGALL